MLNVTTYIRRSSFYKSSHETASFWADVHLSNTIYRKSSGMLGVLHHIKAKCLASLSLLTSSWEWFELHIAVQNTCHEPCIWLSTKQPINNSLVHTVCGKPEKTPNIFTTMKINIDCKLDKLMLGWSCGKGSQGSFFWVGVGTARTVRFS